MPKGPGAVTVRSIVSSAWYHILVLGTELGGLIYAALAAKHGYRVGVLGQGASANTYRHEGHVFQREPDFLYGLSTSPLISRVLSELALAMRLQNRPQALDPTIQVVTPSMRLDVVGHAPRWRREIKRELPGVGGRLLEFEAWAGDQKSASDAMLTANAVFPPSGLREQGRYRTTVAGNEALLLQDVGRAPPSLTALGSSSVVVRAPMAHLCGVRSQRPSLLAAARLWTHLRAGLYRMPSGLDGLKEMFIRKLKDQCGDYRPTDCARAILFRRGKAREVLLADRDETLGCELLVTNGDPLAQLALIPRDDRIHRYHSDLASTVPEAWRFTINLAVDPKVIPAGMGLEVVSVRDVHAPLNGDNCLWISRPGGGPNAGGDRRPRPGALLVSALLPARRHGPTATAVQKLIPGVLAHLRELIPWLDEHLQAVHVPCLKLDAAARGHILDPSALVPTVCEPQPGMLGIGAVPPATPYRNILLGGNQPFCGLGLEGAFLGATQAFALTKRALKLRTTLG